MSFDSIGYELKFIQKERCGDSSPHLFTYIFKFYSPITKYKYIVRAEYHEEDVFSIKFYIQQHSKSDFKYSFIVNKQDTQNILITCAKSIPFILLKHPTASFGILGARTYQHHKEYIEDVTENQRFRVYQSLIQRNFGVRTFSHFKYPKIGGYLLVNNMNEAIKEKEEHIKQMFISAYQTETF